MSSEILKMVVDGDLAPSSKGGVTFYPARELSRVFEWSVQIGRRVEWIEGLFYRPTTGEGQLSVAHIVQRHGKSDADFYAQCLDVASELEREAIAKEMSAYLEIGIST